MKISRSYATILLCVILGITTLMADDSLDEPKVGQDVEDLCAKCIERCSYTDECTENCCRSARFP